MLFRSASTLSSCREVKRLSRAVYAVQPSANEQRPLKWSHLPITFDAEDHPDRTTGVGILPLVVSPVIHNVTVTKMLVDGGAGLNLISTDLLEKLQIPREQLTPTGSFQGVNVGATQPLGKIALPVTFGTRKNYRTKNVTFDVSDMPLPRTADTLQTYLYFLMLHACFTPITLYFIYASVHF